jgi:hypothetical protein
MINKLEGCLDTGDLSEQEDQFVHHLVDLLAAGQVTRLSEKQLAWLHDLHQKHFA